MEYRPLDLTLISAKDLKDVNLFSKMHVYAVATLSNDPRSKQRTPVDKDVGKSPTWNCATKFFIPTANPGGLVLHIQLKSERTLGDRDVGEVHIPVKELLDAGTSDASQTKFISYQVSKPSGKPKGILNISYKIGDPPPAHIGDEPVPPPPQPGYGYGAPPQPPPQGYGYLPPPPQVYGYPLPPQGHGYGYPQPQVYGHPLPPQGHGYGYPQPVVAVGVALLSDALGQLLSGGMVADADNGGGFNFYLFLLLFHNLLLNSGV